MHAGNIKQAADLEGLIKNQREKYDYLVVGAGLWGASFAYKAKQAGKKVLIVEKQDRIAGHIYTEKINDIDVHVFGAHIFHTSDERVWNFVNSFVKFNNFINSPMARYKDEIYNLPFNMNTFSKMWNIRTPDEAQAIIEEQRRAINHEPRNLEEQAISLVGQDVYEKLIKGYTEKQWGRDCKDLPSFIIKRLPVRFTYNNNYFNDPYQGIPENGYTELIERMLDGIDVYLGVDYLEMKEDLASLASFVVYTGSIDRYYAFKFGNLEYRSLHFEHKILDKANFQGNAVINYTEREVPYTRIIEHKHFNPQKAANCEKTIISYEYPKEWSPEDEPYYPINDQKNNEIYAKYKALTEQEENVIFGGRLAEYKYLDMDKTIMSVFKITDELFPEV